MKECNNSKIHISSILVLPMSSNSVEHLFTKTITTLQHFATLHFATLIDTSLPLIYTSQPSHMPGVRFMPVR